MKYRKRCLAAALAAVIAGGAVLSENAVSVSASQNASEKEEVIYAMQDADGTVTGLYVVNSFAGGDIVDYGDYESVRNLTTTDEIKMEDGCITLHTDAEKIYYQGNLKENELPWNISVRYLMDGTEYTAEEIAGRSGSLEIQISVKQNKACREEFWNGYTLQTSLTLDTKKCTDIVAEGATIANVGAKKQISYIILPGKETELTITARVEDFEMDAVSINGTRLNLDLELDTDELTGEVEEIQKAILKLRDGADDLKDGAGELEEASQKLYAGSESLSEGAKTLDEGLASLNSGLSEMQTALKTLDGKSDTLETGSGELLKALKKMQTSLKKVELDTKELDTLVKSSAQIKAGINSLVSGLDTVNTSIDTYYSSLSAAGITDAGSYAAAHQQAAAALGITETQRSLYQAFETSGNAGVMAKLVELAQTNDAEAVALSQQYAASNDAQVIEKYVTEAGTAISLEKLLLGDVSYIQGSESLISGIDAALDKESGELMLGAVTLQTSYGEFHQAVSAMAASLKSLAKNMTTLKSGVDALVKNDAVLDAGISEYTEAVEKIAGAFDEICTGAYSASAGALSLCNGTSEMTRGALQLYAGTESMAEGTKQLADGTDEFYEKTADLDAEISDRIEDTVSEMTGKNVETVSFVSEKNTNVDSVQFVIQIPAVEIAETGEAETEEVQPKSIWQKFLALFGLD